MMNKKKYEDVAFEVITIEKDLVVATSGNPPIEKNPEVKGPGIEIE